MEIKKLFVFARAGIGDIVYTIPALRALRRRYSDAHITLDVGDRGVLLLRSCPYIDEIWVRTRPRGLKGKLAFIHKLRQQRFDMAVILDRSNEKILHTTLAGVPKRYGVQKTMFNGLLTRGVPFDEGAHYMYDHFRQVAALAGCDVSDWSLELFPELEALPEAKRKLLESGWQGDRPLIGINPGASQAHRQWMPDRFARVAVELMKSLNAEIVLLGGPDDGAIADAIIQEMPFAPYNLAGKLSLDETIFVIGLLDAMISGDSGPAHIAAAMQTPVVGLYGPTSSKQYGPAGASNVFIDKSDSCAGCHKWHCSANRACMRLIEVQEVTNAVAKILENADKGARAAHSPG